MTGSLAVAPAERTVIISTAGLDEEQAAAVSEACAHVGARPLPWAGDDRAPAPAADDAGERVVVVAALPSGERHIPDRLVRLVTRDYPGAAMLLLCKESLVRPTVTLQNGRVTLVETPFSVRRIASRLRVLLAEDGPTTDHGALALREHQCPGYWVGALLEAAAQGMAPWLGERRGLTAVVPASEAALAPELLAHVGELVARGGDPELVGGALAALPGIDGLIHLAPRGDEWLFFWPRAERALWLCSTQRLPACWDLAATAQESAGRCVRVPAASGDLAVTLPVTLTEWAGGAASPGVPAHVPAELVETFADGGPAVLEEIEAHLQGRPGSPFALVAEAR
jgi:hypothetical protein